MSGEQRDLERKRRRRKRGLSQLLAALASSSSATAAAELEGHLSAGPSQSGPSETRVMLSHWLRLCRKSSRRPHRQQVEGV